MSTICAPADAAAAGAGPDDELAPRGPDVLAASLDALEVRLREPLRALENVAEAIGSVRSVQQQQHMLRTIKQAALLIERSTEATLDLLRCEYGVLRPDCSIFTLRSILHEIRVVARGSRTRSTRRIQLEFPNSEVVIQGDRRRLVRIGAAVVAALDAWLEAGSGITINATVGPIESDRVELELRIGLPRETQSSAVLSRVLGDGTPAGAVEPEDTLEVRSAIGLARRLGVQVRTLEVPPGVVLRLHCPVVTVRSLPPSSGPTRAATRAPILLFDTPARSLRAIGQGLADSGYEPLRAEHRDEALGILFGRAAAAIVIGADGSTEAPLHFARQVRSQSRSAEVPIVLVAMDLSLAELSMARRYVDGVLMAPVTVADTVRWLNGCLGSDRRATRRALELY